MNFYKHHIGDYDSHTIHLTWSQDLVYRRLISAYYLRERPLPNDFPTLCRMIRATESTHKAALKFILSQFFTLQVPVASAIGDATGDTVSGYTGSWHNSRCDKEIEQYQAQCITNRSNARSPNRSPNRVANGIPNQIPEPEPEETKSNPLAPPGAFEQFWSAYPRKKSKGQAEKAWKAHANGNIEPIMAGLQRAIASTEWAKDNGKFIPYPATWLNAKGWLDEAPTPAAALKPFVV